MKFVFKYWNFFQQRITLKLPQHYLTHCMTRQKKKMFLATLEKKLKPHFRNDHYYYLKNITVTTTAVVAHLYGYSLKGFIAGSQFGGFQTSQEMRHKILRHVQTQC
jgi:hypothetical protein